MEVDEKQLELSELFGQHKCTVCRSQQPSRFCDSCVIACCESCWFRYLLHERRYCPRCCRHRCIKSNYTLLGERSQEICDECMRSVAMSEAETAVDTVLATGSHGL
jgi:hypothetical protein